MRSSLNDFNDPCSFIWADIQRLAMITSGNRSISFFMSFLISVFILDDLSPNIAKYSDKVNVLKFVWIAKSTKGNYKKRNFLKFGKQLLTFWSILQTIVAGFDSLLVLALLRSADHCVSEIIATLLESLGPRS